jgi:hypothetical protein
MNIRVMLTGMPHKMSFGMITFLYGKMDDIRLLHMHGRLEMP